MSTCLHGTKSFFCCLKSLVLTFLVVCLINLGDGGGEYVEGQSLCPCYKSDSHFLSFLEAELHFLISNVQYVTAAFISVHVLRNLYSNLTGPFKKMDTKKIFLPVLTKKIGHTKTLNPLLPFFQPRAITTELFFPYMWV